MNFLSGIASIAQTIIGGVSKKDSLSTLSANLFMIHSILGAISLNVSIPVQYQQYAVFMMGISGSMIGWLTGRPPSIVEKSSNH